MKAIEKHLISWDDDNALRERMLSNLGYIKQRGIAAFLRDMAKAGKVEKAHVDTWNKLRNSVMHGELVKPLAYRGR